MIEGAGGAPFRKTAEQARHLAAAAGFLAAQVPAVEGRRLHPQKGAGGPLWLTGVLDPARGAALLTALSPPAKRTGRYHARTRAPPAPPRGPASAGGRC